MHEGMLQLVSQCQLEATRGLVGASLFGKCQLQLAVAQRGQRDVGDDQRPEGVIPSAAKDLAAEMTGLNVQNKDLKGQSRIENEHIENNKAVRDMLTQRGIIPENLPPAEDVKKLQRKLEGDDKKILKATKKK